MCTTVFIRDPGREIDAECDSIRDLAKHLSDLVPSKHYEHLGKISRMSGTCLCQIDVQKSADASGFVVIEKDPCDFWTLAKRKT